jgi:hypothetical protein
MATIDLPESASNFRSRPEWMPPPETAQSGQSGTASQPLPDGLKASGALCPTSAGVTGWSHYVPLRTRSLCKKPGHVGKRLQFERIARRVQEEHRRLFADLSFESDMRLDDEANTGVGQPPRCFIPLIHA